jgi:ribulose-bisphosphate carboxylase small chain
MKGWGVGVEYTDDPHPRNSYWEMWGNPNFKATDAAALAYEIRQCCAANPASYVKIAAFDNTRGVESCTMAFLVQRPMVEPGFRLVRQEGVNRNICYTLESYTQQYGGA